MLVSGSAILKFQPEIYIITFKWEAILYKNNQNFEICLAFML